MGIKERIKINKEIHKLLGKKHKELDKERKKLKGGKFTHSQRKKIEKLSSEITETIKEKVNVKKKIERLVRAL